MLEFGNLSTRHIFPQVMCIKLGPRVPNGVAISATKSTSTVAGREYPAPNPEKNVRQAIDPYMCLGVGILHSSLLPTYISTSAECCIVVG